MNLRNLFGGRAMVFGMILLLGLFAFIYKTYFSTSNISPTSTVSRNDVADNTEPPVFLWSYEQDDSLNPDGNPQTNIFLKATYSNGVVQRKLIDTTPGSCNDLPDTDVDSVAGTTNIQCYSAGLGYRFKITKGESSYLVQRKEFEEGSPDYNPPEQKYRVVLEFPNN